MSRQVMRNIIERMPTQYNINQIREEWEVIKPNMSRMGMLNACLPKEGVDRLKYFYIENPNIEPFLKDTIFEKIIRALPIKISRGTFLNLIPNQCLRWHRDPDNKIHIPINDTPGSFFYDFTEQEAYPVKADGYPYRYYTSGRYHTAFNASCFDRTHLVLAEYHCRNSEPSNTWTQEFAVTIPKDKITYPPKISVGDSIEQAFFVPWVSKVIHAGWLYSGSASDEDTEDYLKRTYKFTFIDPDKMVSTFDGEYTMLQVALQQLGMTMLLGDNYQNVY